MREYNLVLVLEPQTSESERKKLLELVARWFGEGRQGKVQKLVEWGKKTLVFPIKKFREGFYVVLTLATEKTVSGDLEKKLLMEEKILRHLLVRK